MTRTATLCALVASVSLSAQTSPPPPATNSSVTVSGCVAEVQRDGSLGVKATGAQATPETAPMEANNPTPTDRYQLMDATPTTPPAGTAKPISTTYALRGQDKELANHLGHRVQITGVLLAPLTAKLPPKAAATAEGIRTLQVNAVKMVGMDCKGANPK